MTTTSCPARLRVIAAAQPAGPAPTTSTSVRNDALDVSEVSGSRGEGDDIDCRLEGVGLWTEAGTNLSRFYGSHHDVEREPNRFREWEERKGEKSGHRERCDDDRDDWGFRPKR